MFGIKNTVDDDVDTLSRYPVITPFGTAGGSHDTALVTVISLIFPGTE